MNHTSSRFAPARTVSAADRSVSEAAEAGVIMETVDDVDYVGRYVQIAGKKLLNFATCSYLGLEQRQELKQGAIEAIERFGTQFSYSRAYLQLPLYEKLEEALGSMTDGYALVTPTTTLAHIAALPVLIESGDAVIVDQFAHASLQTATALLRSTPVHTVRHNRMDHLEDKIATLVTLHRRVWLVIDGLYSMLGDFAPLAQIASLLEAYPQLHVYVDDAHSTSWYGKHGRGYALEHLRDRSRVVVALSLNKAFSSGGGALVFPTAEQRFRVRRCGGPMLFSGPLQPALLGAALASANIHLKPDFEHLQQGLADRIDRALWLGAQLDVPFVTTDRSPIFFVRIGDSRAAFELSRALRQRGNHLSISVFPAVPQKQAGVRFTLSLANTMEDIDQFIAALAEEGKRLGTFAARERITVSGTNSLIPRIFPRSFESGPPPP